MTSCFSFMRARTEETGIDLQTLHPSIGFHAVGGTGGADRGRATKSFRQLMIFDISLSRAALGRFPRELRTFGVQSLDGAKCGTRTAATTQRIAHPLTRENACKHWPNVMSEPVLSPQCS
jgi:hypothetical protein